MVRQRVMMRRMAAMRSQGMQSARGGVRPQANQRMQGAWQQRAEAMRGAMRRFAMRQA
jgi:hypothetical protein